MQQYINHIKEVFRDFSPITTRRMFGGYGIYHEGIMFALVANEQLYLKADNSIKHYFEELKQSQFEYKRGNKLIKISYYLAPTNVLEDPEQATIWGRRSFIVAKQQYKPKKNLKPKFRS